MVRSAETLKRVDLVLRAETLRPMVQWMVDCVPYEGCGVVVQRPGDSPTRWVPLHNTHRFAEHAWRFDADEYGDLLTTLEHTGERILMVNHSHPTGPPQLSPQDIAGALDPTLFYGLVTWDAGNPTLGVWQVVGSVPLERTVSVA